MNSRKATHGGRPSRVRSSIALSSAVLSPCLAAASSALADQPSIADLPTSWAALANDSAMRPSENQKPDFSSDIEARKSHVIPALEILGLEVLLNQINRHSGNGADYESNLSTIRHNLGRRQRPVQDQSTWSPISGLDVSRFRAVGGPRLLGIVRVTSYRGC
jgi:hypothetical protein